jgi:excisionase family DNA binding protein
MAVQESRAGDFAFLALALPVDDTELLTVSQVAEALSASSQTIRNWIRAEQLRGVRIGSRFLIPRAEVDRLRGDVSVTRGESPWDSALDTPIPPLPRATEREFD